MLLVQALFIAFFLFAIFKVGERFRTREISLWSAILWVGFWVAASVIVLLPNSTSYVAEIVGVGRGADFVVYLSLIFIFFSIFRLLITVEKMKREITVLTRSLALEDKKKEV